MSRPLLKVTFENKSVRSKIISRKYKIKDLRKLVKTNNNLLEECKSQEFINLFMITSYPDLYADYLDYLKLIVITEMTNFLIVATRFIKENNH